jgi:hypothetical protein
MGKELGMNKPWGLSSVQGLDGPLEMLSSDILTKEEYCKQPREIHAGSCRLMEFNSRM